MAEVDTTPILPAHIEGTVEAIARLHAEHRERATPLQSLIEGLTARTGRPSFLAWLTIAVVGWVGVNLALAVTGRKPVDEAPFEWLELVVSLVALYVTVMILTTQRRDDELASHREQLTLELAILADRKTSKLIELLEELRRDMPTVRDRVDRDAASLSAPADPQAVLDAIQESHDELAGVVADGAVQ